MTEDVVMRLVIEALKTTALVASPLLLAALIVGLFFSVFQALTQINEASLAFVPKVIAVGASLILFGPWMLDVLSNYTTQLFSSFVEIVRN